MKFGLITFHDTSSMGGNLQCFALYQLLKQRTDDVTIIKYDRYPELKARRKKKSSVKSRLISAATSFSGILDKRYDALQKKKIRDFSERNLCFTSETYYNVDELKAVSDSFDCYFAGSDQVWNPIAYGLEAYFLTFVDPSKKTIAYAPSIGIREIPDRIKTQYTEWLSHVQYLSCREKEGAELLSRLTGRTAENVLDPTLVLNHEEWKSLITFPACPAKKKYLLCYFLGSMSYERTTAKKIAKELNLDIVYLYNNPVERVRSGKVIRGYGVEEFLSWFENASFICTDSFHGTAFAVNFNKPFFTFARRGYTSSSSSSVFSRIENLMKILHCEERIVTPKTKYCQLKPGMDYSQINKLLESERNKSKQYLTRCINDKL